LKYQNISVQLSGENNYFAFLKVWFVQFSTSFWASANFLSANSLL
jgi:hypothetical protein